MTSVNTNAAATTALRTLQQTNAALDKTQNRISTGLKIGEAKDNAAYWSISTTLKSDNKSLSTVKDALGLGSATVDVAYQGLNKAKDVLDEIKSKLTAASGSGVNKDTIQKEIGELQNQLKSIASSSIFSGENWLSVDSSIAGYDSTKSVVASFSRDANNAVTIGTIEVDASGVALFDNNADTTQSGIVDGAQSLKDAQGRALSYGGAAMTGNSDAGGLAAATSTGTAAVKATSTFTGAFTSATLDADDEIALSFKADNATTASSITLKVGDVSGSGVAVAGTIGSVDELVYVVNNSLKSNGISDVTAVKNGNSFALQRADGGVNKTVEVVSFTGSDATFTNAKTVALGSNASSIGYAGQTETLTFATTATSAGNLTITLATGETKTFTGVIVNGATAAQIATAVTAAINGASELNGAVTAADSGGAGVVTLTYKSAGVKGALTASETATATTLAVSTVASAYAANSATSSAVVGGAASAVFKDADDRILFKFTDSLVGGGTVQTVEITKADLETANITDMDIDDGTDLRAALAAAFTRQATTNSLFANYDVTSASATDITITRRGPGVAGQQVQVLAGTGGSDVLTFVDPSAAVTNTFGQSVSAGVKRGTNATEAAAASTLALPSGGIVLDADDSLYFDLAVGGGVAKTVTIDKALIDSTLATSTKPKVVMGQFDVAGLQSSNTTSFTIEWNGTAATYSITALTKDSTINDVVTKINAAAGFSTYGVASVENNRIVITAATAGSTQRMQITSVSGSNLYAGKGGLQTTGLTFGSDAVASANGTIANASQYARVMNAAIGLAGVAGAVASVSGGNLSIASTDAGATASVAVSNVVASAGANKISLDKIDISTAGLEAVGARSADQIQTLISSYISLVSSAITKVTEAASNLGSVSSRIDMQQSFVDTLMDTIDKGVGELIDADMTEESTKLQALQTKQQLGIQALSIANASTQNILSLFQ